jgi:hypothetical protein
VNLANFQILKTKILLGYEGHKMKITNRKYFCIDFGAKTSVIPNLAIILFCVWINQDLW